MYIFDLFVKMYVLSKKTGQGKYWMVDDTLLVLVFWPVLSFKPWYYETEINKWYWQEKNNYNKLHKMNNLLMAQATKKGIIIKH